MKIAGAQIGGVLRAPQTFAGLLLHGDDTGLIREWSATAARRIVPSLDDPFRAATLMREEHSRVMDEAQSLSLAGGRRVVRVRDAGDGLAGLVAKLDTIEAALVIFEAGALNARSKLRQAAEKAGRWASIACYPQTGAALATDIRRTLEGAGLTVSPDALALLCRDLAGDTATRRSEIEKLVVYAGSDRQIDLDMAIACCSGATEASVDQLLAAVLRGDAGATAGLLHEVAEEGATGPGMIVALSNRLQRLLKVRLEIQAGRDAEEAVRRLMPPVFFREVGAFVREAQMWPEAGLVQVLAESRMADMACKRAGARDMAIASQLFLSTCRRALRLSRGL